jgi:hypothetical protein
MSENTRLTRSRGALVDIPLPGSFDVLTVQINATLYPKAQTGKYVAVLRDPIAQIEIQREGMLETRLAVFLSALDVSTRAIVRQALYMGGLNPEPID